MAINTVIREKRKELGLTQEQVANFLGVSAPAVNKWEKGATYPDIALLPALARLLKTDLNTLLCFHEELSQKEIALFLNRIAETVHDEGYAAAFAQAMEKVQEYPNNGELLHSLAMVLEGSLMMTELDPEQKKAYNAKILSLYERAAGCDDAQCAARANYALAGKLIAGQEYEKAQEKLDALPDYNALDKRRLQADLWLKAGKSEQAAQLLEHKLLQSVQDVQMTLLSLAKIAVEEGDVQNALCLAACGQKEVEVFGLWEYSAYIVPLEVAVLRRDAAGGLAVLKPMLAALLTPWEMARSPVCKHIRQKAGEGNLGVRALPSLLSELENSNEYDFLRAEPEFQQLIAHYRAKC